MRKILSVILTMALVICIFPMGVFDVTADAVTSGYYTYIVSNGNATIIDVSDTISGNITVPTMLGGYPVTSIGDSAFEKCESVKSIIIPNGIIYIADRAFSRCSSLVSVNISDSVTGLGDYVFSNCANLKSVTIGNSVKSIGNCAFLGCSSLQGIKIPNSVKSIGNCAFFCCYSLQGIKIPNSVKSIGYSAFFECSSITYADIPDGVISIGELTFAYCTSLKTVSLGNSVESIGMQAFYCCISLISVNIPSSVTSIDYLAFTNCNSLTNVIVDLENEKYCDINGVLYSKDKTEIIKYPAGKTETTYIIPNGVTRIANWSFDYFGYLINISIPISVTEIGELAFYSCEKIDNIFYRGSAEEAARITIKENPALDGATWHYNSCMGKTEHTYVSDCDITCSECGKDRTPLFEHEYDNVCDENCNKCSFERVAEHQYTDNCDSVCNVCSKKRKAPHYFDGENGLICNVCLYEIPPYTIGDLDGDKDILTSDLALMKLHLAGAITLDETGELAGDIDANGEVDATDLALLKLHLAGARPIV